MSSPSAHPIVSRMGMGARRNEPSTRMAGKYSVRPAVSYRRLTAAQPIAASRRGAALVIARGAFLAPWLAGAPPAPALGCVLARTRRSLRECAFGASGARGRGLIAGLSLTAAEAPRRREADNVFYQRLRQCCCGRRSSGSCAVFPLPSQADEYGHLWSLCPMIRTGAAHHSRPLTGDAVPRYEPDVLKVRRRPQCKDAGRACPAA